MASLRVIVMVEVAVPSATTGLVPLIVEFAATAGPDEKTTDPSTFTTGVCIDKVFVSALNELSVQVEIPVAFVVLHAPYTFVTPVSVAEKVGV